MHTEEICSPVTHPLPSYHLLINAQSQIMIMSGSCVDFPSHGSLRPIWRRLLSLFSETKHPWITPESASPWINELYRYQSKMSSSKKLNCKWTLRQVFIRVYRLEIQSVMLVFSTQHSKLLPLSTTLWFNSPPPFPV